MRRLKKKNDAWLGWLMIAIGLALILVAMGIVETNPSSIHAPMWVIALCAVVFSTSGLMILLGPTSPANALGAFVICVCFGLVGAWVALFASPESISGGLPFLSRSTNGVIGKWVFGIGALISFAIAGVAWREFRRAK